MQAPIYIAFRYIPRICQMYSGAVRVNTRHANKIAGAAHSN